jgi:hypothetical protein
MRGLARAVVDSGQHLECAGVYVNYANGQRQMKYLFDMNTSAFERLIEYRPNKRERVIAFLYRIYEAIR